MIIHFYKGEFGVGGLESTMLLYSNVLSQAGHEVILATGKSAYSEKEVNQCLPAKSSFHILNNTDKTSTQFISDCDLLIIANAHRQDNKSLLSTCDGYVPHHLINRLGNLPSCKREWENLLLSKYIFVQSHDLAFRIQSQLSVRNQVIVVPNPIDYYNNRNNEAALIRQVHGIKQQTILFYPGRIVHRRTGKLIQRKGLAVLLHAFARLYADQPDIVLMIGGNDPSCTSTVKQAQNLINSMLRNLVVPLDRVVFLSHSECAPWKIKAAFSTADIVIQPNIGPEPYGNIVIETLLSGRPFIGSPHITVCRDIVSILKSNDSAFFNPITIVSPNSTSSLVSAILRLLKIPSEIRTAIVLSSLEMIRQHYCPGKLVDVITTVANQIKDRSPSVFGGIH